MIRRSTSRFNKHSSSCPNATHIRSSPVYRFGYDSTHVTKLYIPQSKLNDSSRCFVIIVWVRHVVIIIFWMRTACRRRNDCNSKPLLLSRLTPVVAQRFRADFIKCIIQPSSCFLRLYIIISISPTVHRNSNLLNSDGRSSCSDPHPLGSAILEFMDAYHHAAACKCIRHRDNWQVSIYYIMSSNFHQIILLPTTAASISDDVNLDQTNQYLYCLPSRTYYNNDATFGK